MSIAASFETLSRARALDLTPNEVRYVIEFLAGAASQQLGWAFDLIEEDRADGKPRPDWENGDNDPDDGPTNTATNTESQCQCDRCGDEHPLPPPRLS